MPKLRIPQEKILADIKAGVSFVKVVPDNIGEIMYFDTDNPTDVSKSKIVYMIRKLLVALLTLAVIAGLWYSMDSLVWRIILTVIVGFFGFAFIVLQSFHGTDYFVGTQGYGKLSFSGSRDNIKVKEVHTFDESDHLAHSEVRNFTNGIYMNTSYSFAFLSSVGATGTAKELYSSHAAYINKKGGADTGNGDYDFWYQIEVFFTRYIIEKYRQQMESEGKITFMVVSDNSILKGVYTIAPILHLSPGVVQYGTRSFNDSSAEAKIEGQTLCFKYKSHVSGEMATLASIPMDKIVNLYAFMALLPEFYNMK